MLYAKRKVFVIFESATNINRAIEVLTSVGGELDVFVALRNLQLGISSDKLLILYGKISHVENIAKILGKLTDIDVLIVVLGRMQEADLGSFIRFLVRIKNAEQMSKLLHYFIIASDTHVLLILFKAEGSLSNFLKTLANITDLNKLLNIATNLSESTSDLKALVKGLKYYNALKDIFVN